MIQGIKNTKTHIWVSRCALAMVHKQAETGLVKRGKKIAHMKYCVQEIIFGTKFWNYMCRRQYQKSGITGNLALSAKR